jgi:hypothetical protein
MKNTNTTQSTDINTHSNKHDPHTIKPPILKPAKRQHKQSTNLQKMNGHLDCGDKMNFGDGMTTRKLDQSNKNYKTPMELNKQHNEKHGTMQLT